MRQLLKRRLAGVGTIKLWPNNVTPEDSVVAVRRLVPVPKTAFVYAAAMKRLAERKRLPKPPDEDS